MKKTIILGCTVYAKLLRYTMEHDANIETDAYCLSSEYIKDPEFDGRPVIPFEMLNERYGRGNFRILIAVGYRGMNIGRERLFHQCTELDYEIASFTESTARIKTESVGRGNIILGNSCLQPFSQIGDGNLLCDTIIGHDSILGSFNYLAPHSTIGGVGKIGNNCFIGIGASIGDHVSIGDYTLIGAGAVLSQSVEPNSIVAAPKMRIKQGRPELLGGLFK